MVDFMGPTQNVSTNIEKCQAQKTFCQYFLDTPHRRPQRISPPILRASRDLLSIHASDVAVLNRGIKPLLQGKPYPLNSSGSRCEIHKKIVPLLKLHRVEYRMPDNTIANRERPKIAVVSANLNPKSKTRILLQAVADRLQHYGGEVSWIGLDQEQLPLCDGYLCYQEPRVQELTAEIQSSDAIVLASPVYNYDFNAVAKNFLELTGSAWKGKPVAFVLTAGGPGSYMAPTSFANSLWLDYHCFLYPHFLYATGHDFAGDTIESENVLTRLENLSKGFVHFAKVIRTGFPVS